VRCGYLVVLHRLLLAAPRRLFFVVPSTLPTAPLAVPRP
jgi:hypothetical protein